MRIKRVKVETLWQAKPQMIPYLTSVAIPGLLIIFVLAAIRSILFYKGRVKGPIVFQGFFVLLWLFIPVAFLLWYTLSYRYQETNTALEERRLFKFLHYRKLIKHAKPENFLLKQTKLDRLFDTATICYESVEGVKAVFLFLDKRSCAEFFRMKDEVQKRRSAQHRKREKEQ